MWHTCHDGGPRPALGLARRLLAGPHRRRRIDPRRPAPALRRRYRRSARRHRHERARGLGERLRQSPRPLAGAISGFFGIGGGFLIVPGIMLGSGMPILNAIGSSLLSVGVFGLTTAANYALSGLVAWAIAAEFIVGGVLGGWFGTRLAVK